MNEIKVEKVSKIQKYKQGYQQNENSNNKKNNTSLNYAEIQKEANENERKKIEQQNKQKKEILDTDFFKLSLKYKNPNIKSIKKVELSEKEIEEETK